MEDMGFGMQFARPGNEQFGPFTKKTPVNKKNTRRSPLQPPWSRLLQGGVEKGGG